MRVLLYTPMIDDRSRTGVISSRIGLSREVVAFDGDFDLFADIKKQHESDTVSCVFLDESQFMTPAQVLQLTLVCDQLKIPVLCYGLRTDFQGEPFEGSKYLLAMEIACSKASKFRSAITTFRSRGKSLIWSVFRRSVIVDRARRKSPFASRLAFFTRCVCGNAFWLFSPK